MPGTYGFDFIHPTIGAKVAWKAVLETMYELNKYRQMGVIAHQDITRFDAEDTVAFTAASLLSSLAFNFGTKAALYFAGLDMANDIHYAKFQDRPVQPTTIIKVWPQDTVRYPYIQIENTITNVCYRVESDFR